MDRPFRPSAPRTNVRALGAFCGLACLSGTVLPDAAHLGWRDREELESRSAETVAGEGFREQGRYASFVIFAINTGERVVIDLDGEGQPTDEALLRVNHAFRSIAVPRRLRDATQPSKDAATPREIPIHAPLVALLGRIARRTGKPISLISAYRAPTAGENNFHTRGEAADIRVDGVETDELWLLAKELGATGLGYYPVAKMVHVDLREKPFRWTDYSPTVRLSPSQIGDR